MKNIIKLIGIIALAAVIGFSFTACGDGSGGTNTEKGPDTGGGDDPGTGGDYDDGGTGSGTEEDPFTLTAGKWKNGSVPKQSSQAWYSFSVTSGTMYHVWWNENGSGDGTKTGNVVVYAKYSGETSSIFVLENSGWAIPKSFIASTSGTVQIIVMEWGGTGTFAIAYSIDPARPGSGGGSYTQGWPPSSVLSEFGISGLTIPPGTTAAQWFQTSYKSEKGLVIQATTTADFSHFEDYFTSNNWTKMSEQTSHPTLTQKKWGKPSVEAQCSKNSSDNQLALTVKFM